MLNWLGLEVTESLGILGPSGFMILQSYLVVVGTFRREGNLRADGLKLSSGY